MKRNKHLLLWSSLGALALLLVAAGQENLGKEWRRLQRRVDAAAVSPGLSIRLRQVVVPALDVTDRCISCHVGMAPGETGLAADPVLGSHPDVLHDPADFGCTTCHAGQGRATEEADAHGRVPHWPHPMIPLRHADAGCGSCHTFGEIPEFETLQRGLRFIEQKDCLACHAMDGRGGTLRPGEATEVAGGDLSRVGARGSRRDWYTHHLSEHRRAGGGSWKTSMGAIEPAELAAIEVALDTRVGAPDLIAAKSLFHTLGCLGCHKVAGVGGDDGPDLTNVGDKDPAQTDFSHVSGERSLVAWFTQHFRNPATVVPGSLMPDLGLTEDQIDLLTLYMLSLRRRDLPQSYWPQDRLATTRFGESEFSRDPATLYGTYCSACHGPRGEGMRYPGMTAFPAIASEDFLRVASNEFIRETIRRGRPGRRMPAWGGENVLTETEIDELVHYLRQLGGVPAPEPWSWRGLARADAQSGERLYADACASCHGSDGGGQEGPALSNAVFLETASDGYIAETIRRGRAGTSMEAFGTPSVRRPTLSDEEIASIVAHVRSWEVSR